MTGRTDDSLTAALLAPTGRDAALAEECLRQAGMRGDRLPRFRRALRARGGRGRRGAGDGGGVDAEPGGQARARWSGRSRSGRTCRSSSSAHVLTGCGRAPVSSSTSSATCRSSIDPSSDGRWSRRSGPRFAGGSGNTRPAARSPRASSSWRCSATSCEIRWRRSCFRPTFSAAATATKRRCPSSWLRSIARPATSIGWSTTCWTWAG